MVIDKIYKFNELRYIIDMIDLERDMIDPHPTDYEYTLSSKGNSPIAHYFSKSSKSKFNKYKFLNIL